MSETWNVFHPPPTPSTSSVPTPRDLARNDARTLTRAVFGAGPGAAWLAMMQADAAAQPSYQPGDTFDQVAWREGRKALLRDIQLIVQSQESIS